MDWEKSTDIILVASIGILGVFAILGLIQLIKRKSIKKVDRALLAFIPSLILLVITYFAFDKLFVLNTRPNDSGEPSFPSTHVMIVATVFSLVALALPQYINSKIACIILDVLMLILIAIVSVGRVLSLKHWPLDVVGGLAFAAIFALVYYLITFRKEKK